MRVLCDVSTVRTAKIQTDFTEKLNEIFFKNMLSYNVVPGLTKNYLPIVE